MKNRSKKDPQEFGKKINHSESSDLIKLQKVAQKTLFRSILLRRGIGSKWTPIMLKDFDQQP